MEEEEILNRLMELRKKDPRFSDGKILSSVSTKPRDPALEAYRIFSDTNALDANIFPEIRKLEKDVIKWFGDLLNNPGLDGYITSGGTEANIVALWIAKKIYPDRRKILASKSAHYSIERAADLMSLEMEWISLQEDFKPDLEEMEEKLKKDVMAVIATAGTSALGVVDPIEEINSLCKDVFFHIDAAFGGFVLPFLDNSPRIDFTLENLDSITIDPHKMGLAPIPAGSILFRNDSYLRRIEVKPKYLPFTTSTLVGTRPGASIAGVWASLMYYGKEGYRKVVEECMTNTRFLCDKIREMENVELVVEPQVNMVGIRTPDMEEVWKALIEKEWRLSMDSMSNSIRIVVMPHVTRKVIEKFLQDLVEILSR